MPLGITSKFYVNLGTFLVPQWEEAHLIRDLAITGSWNRADASVRVPRVQTQEPTNLVLELTGSIRKKFANTAYAALRAAFLNASVIDVMVLDGALDVDGVEGRRFEGKVFDFGEDQALGNVTFNDFTIIPCISDNLPQSVTVAGGSPVYTNIVPETPQP